MYKLLSSFDSLGQVQSISPPAPVEIKFFAKFKFTGLIDFFLSKILRQFIMSCEVSARVPSKSKSIAFIFFLIIYFFTM